MDFVKVIAGRLSLPTTVLPISKPDGGIAIIEFVVALPIVLIFILSVIFFATYANAKSGLTSSVQNAVRLAKTRSQIVTLNGGNIQDLISWQGSGNSYLHQPLLSSTSSFPVIDYSAFSAGQSGVTDIIGAEVQCLYAMAYVYQAMQKAVGKTVNYPCALSAGAINDDGCVSCWPVDDAQPAGCDGIKCMYRPSDVFIDPIEGLMSMLTGNTDYQFEINPKAAYFFDVN